MVMKLKLLPPTAACIVLAGSLAAADYPEVLDRLSGMVDDINDVTIAESPIQGLLEVGVSSEIIYMTADGRFLIQGRVLDLETRTDITNTARTKLRKDALAGLNREEWISFGPRDAEHEILVFTDPDCGYCRRLHQQMQDYNEAGIRISYLAFPRAGVGSATYTKMVSVWCARDKHHAMDVAKGGGEPEPATCENPVDEQYEFGKILGVTGTPALVTFNGDLIPGYVPPSQLRERLDGLANGE